MFQEGQIVKILKGHYAGRFGTIVRIDDSNYSNLLVAPDFSDFAPVWLSQNGEAEAIQ